MHRLQVILPSIYDHGTHYVTNQRLTLEILKEISDCDDVLEVAGEYLGSCGSIGSIHERSSKRDTYRCDRTTATKTTNLSIRLKTLFIIGSIVAANVLSLL
jgi:hypothetical protein